MYDHRDRAGKNFRNPHRTAITLQTVYVWKDKRKTDRNGSGGRRGRREAQDRRIGGFGWDCILGPDTRNA